MSISFWTLIKSKTDSINAIKTTIPNIEVQWGSSNVKGKDHIFISITWALLISCPIITMNSTYVLMFVIGVFIGSLLPDIDASVSPYEKRGDVMRGAGYAVSASSKITGKIFRSIKDDPNNKYESHRGLLHSVPGVFVASLLIVIPLNLILYFVNYWNSGLIIASIGLFAGALFHLLEDCCTCSGIRLFYPFSEKKLRGGINTFLPDRRPKQFATMFAILAVAFYVYINSVQKTPAYAKYNFIEGLTTYQLVGVAAFISLLLWVIMYIWSQHPINCKRNQR